MSRGLLVNRLVGTDLKRAKRAAERSEATSLTLVLGSSKYNRMRARALMSENSESCDFKNQIRNAPGFWGPDWSTLHRGLECQQAFAEFIVRDFPPDLVACFWDAENSSKAALLRKLRELRNCNHESYDRTEFRHRMDRPKFEYIAAYEVGTHPAHSYDPRGHLHVLLYTAAEMDTRRLKRAWGRISGLGKDGSRICKFQGRAKGQGYILKTYGTSADHIVISDKLPQIAPKEDRP